MMTDETQVVWRCRYRLATGCTAEGKKQAMYAHEKSNVAHEDHRVVLRDCPVCGAGCGDEVQRATHLSAEHGIRAGSERRQELDAVQVKELFDAAPAVTGAGLVPDAAANGSFTVTHHDAPPPVPAASLNGHSPAVPDVAVEPDLAAAEAVLAALIAEVKRLRAAVDPDVAADAARYRQIMSVVNAQD